MDEKPMISFNTCRNPLVQGSLEETAAYCCAALEALSSVQVDETVSGKFRLGYPLLLSTVIEALESHTSVKRIVDEVNQLGPSGV